MKRKKKTVCKAVTPEAQEPLVQIRFTNDRGMFLEEVDTEGYNHDITARRAQDLLAGGTRMRIAIQGSEDDPRLFLMAGPTQVFVSPVVKNMKERLAGYVTAQKAQETPWPKQLLHV